MLLLILEDLIDPTVSKMLRGVIGFKTQLLSIFNRFIIMNPELIQ
jgi:hypothetical protein